MNSFYERGTFPKAPAVQQRQSIGEPPAEGNASNDPTKSPYVQRIAELIAAHLPLLLEPSAVDALRIMRSRVPFVPIMNFPTGATCISNDGTAATDIAIPDGTVLAMLRGTAPFMVRPQAIAAWPAAGDAGRSINGNERQTGFILGADETLWFYCPGIKTISVIGQAAMVTYISVAYRSDIGKVSA